LQADGARQLNLARELADAASMKRTEMECPVCDQDIPLHGDERVGAEVYCVICGVMSKLTKPAEDDDAELEADW
jgi:hypothetical protein